MKLSNFSPIGRAVGVIGVTAGLVTGVTFAAFNTNSVVLADSDLTVSSDVLRISNGGAYGTNVEGFTDNLTPNTPSPKHAFYLQNLANEDLSISVGIIADNGNLNGDNIIFRFYDDTNTEVLAKTYTELSTSPQLFNPSGNLNANAQGTADGNPTEGDYTYTVEVGGAGMNGSTGMLENYDLTFSGTSTGTVTPPAGGEDIDG